MRNRSAMTLDEIIDAAKKRANSPEPTNPILIMVAGGSATGKSTQVLPRLLQAFGDDALLVEQDWYQLGLDFTDKDTSPYRWDDPKNFRIDMLAKDVATLREGQVVDAPAFDVVTVISNGTHRLVPRPIIVVDGLYSLYGPLGDLADYGIYVTLPVYARFLRRLFRMIYDQRVNKPQTALKHTFGSVLKAHKELVSRQADSANCIVTLPYSFEDTIARYHLEEIGEAPTAATIIFEHEGLQFRTSHDGPDSRFYIVQDGKLYYEFTFETALAELLADVDYLSL